MTWHPELISLDPLADPDAAGQSRNGQAGSRSGMTRVSYLCLSVWEICGIRSILIMNKNKGVIALLAILITLVMGVLSLISARFFFGGGEDSWVCVQGDWIADGKPAAPKPQVPCGK